MSDPRIEVEVGARPQSLRLHSAPKSDRTPSPAVARLLALRDAAAIEAETAAALTGAREALADGVASLPRLVHDELRAVADSAAELGLAIAAALADGAIDVGRFDPRALVERCLAEVLDEAGSVRLRVRVAPADLARLREAMRAELDAGAELVADELLPRGAVRVETARGAGASYDLRAVCARVSQRIREELHAG